MTKKGYDDRKKDVLFDTATAIFLARQEEEFFQEMEELPNEEFHFSADHNDRIKQIISGFKPKYRKQSRRGKRERQN